MVHETKSQITKVKQGALKTMWNTGSLAGQPELQGQSQKLSTWMWFQSVWPKEYVSQI